MPAVLLLALALGQSPPVTKEAVDAAVERGVKHLLERYQDGEGRDVGSPLQPRFELVDRPGLRALTVYALLKSGVEPTNPVVEKLLARLSFESFHQTYDASIMVLVLCALDAKRNREWIGELAGSLLEGRL